MKQFFILFSCVFTPGLSFGQTLNQLEILPAYPGPTDTILLISDFSYQGDCAFGLVGMYSNISDSSVLVYPIYCGYGNTNPCSRIDTFRIGPLESGSYPLTIEYHQGSVCPISNFDALIYQYDTMLHVNTTAVSDLPAQTATIDIYPNPARAQLNIFLESASSAHRLCILNILGQKVFETDQLQEVMHIPTADWGAPGMYCISLSDGSGRVLQTRKVIVRN